MKVTVEPWASDELRELAESGKPVPWAQEKFHFTSDARTLVFTLDNLGRARLKSVIIDGKYWFVETLSRAVAGNKGVERSAHRLLQQAVAWLRDERNVRHIEVFDRQSGMAQPHQVDDLIRFSSNGSEE